ncbi:MAG TPA: polysaccharide deacetylase family protein [Kiritimatiellia bacterium]
MRDGFPNRRKRDRLAAWGQWLAFAACWLAAWCGWNPQGHFPSLWLAVLALGSALILVRTTPRRIPVLNYHSISPRPGWLQIDRWISITPRAFERQLAWLKARGYESLLISEVHDALAGRLALDPRRNYVALTFDDGYADNWMAAFPLLKKYGLKATFFVSTDFIMRDDRIRKTLDDVKDEASLPWEGYLTWAEMKAMQASGLAEFQSHGATHSRVFTDDALRGFVGPGKPNLWLLWDTHSETKSRWWVHLPADRSLWGHPVFPQQPSLAARACVPDPQAVDHMLAWTRERGDAFFERTGWETELREEWLRTASRPSRTARRESPEAYRLRVRRELASARATLERELSAPVRFLCWPENAFTETAESAAFDTGHVATVANSHGSLNRIGQDPRRIARLFVGSHLLGFNAPLVDHAGFIVGLKVFEGWYALYPLLAAASVVKRTVEHVRKRTSCRKDFLSTWG